MNILKLLRLPKIAANLPTVVVFAGGMGTQIIQAAAYFALKHAGRPVYADMSYFETAAKMAQVGKAGELTHWFWQLDQFGLPMKSFDTDPSLNKKNADILRDGARMLELGLEALAKPEIQNIFKDVADIRNDLPQDVLSGYLCMHIRRGDYVNVASHLISDDQFIGLAKKFSGFTNSVVVLSDSPIPLELRQSVSSHFRESLFLDNIDAYTSHRIMRSARILVCSNSTFSLTAAALNPNGLIVIPKQWFGEKDRELEVPIHSRCSFQIMS